MEVRIAAPADAPAIIDIYAPYVLATSISFESEVPSVQEMEKRIDACLTKFPWIICELDGKVAGYVYASSHREREAYQWTCECSVYIHPDYKGKGVGSQLYKALFALLTVQGMRTAYAGITLPNDASVRIHERLGFEFFALYDHVGYKLHSWHKVGWWKLRLNEYDPAPAPPLKFSHLDLHQYAAILQEAEQKIRSRII
ncbi:MAG: arsinothricin resistance N-acetyltransferase ArsN1 family B [Flavisolibacter sp.]